jgi:G3E family GTPase
VLRCRCADYVVLNKTDLLKDGELAQLQAIVASLNPFATARSVLQHWRCQQLQ